MMLGEWCKKCVWAVKLSEIKMLCPFGKCIMKRRVAGDSKDKTTDRANVPSCTESTETTPKTDT